jgi:hypothetical protein
VTSGSGSRLALWAGVAGPIGFLVVAFALALVRHDVLEQQGWASWPSSMALDGVAGLPMVVAFLWLGACYAVFALGALRPARVAAAAVAGYLVTASGDVLLAFPTDASAQPLSWHGGLHLAGVLVATAGTLVVAIGLLVATGGHGAWRPLRPAVAVVVGASAIGLVGGFEAGWAKVAYVVGITLPAVVVPWCLDRDLRGRRDGLGRPPVPLT